MKAKEKAESLVDTYRIMLMNEDTECGNEILCTVISKRCALICIDEMIQWKEALFVTEGSMAYQYLLDVKHEIEKL
jgi:hypothetical protein